MRCCSQAARPIILNGIEEVITRPDLADRAIFLTLGPITEAQRRPENELWREFELARPQILGALLDAAAHGLRALPQVRLQRLPAHGRLCPLGDGVRDRVLAGGHLRARLLDNRSGRDRRRARRRSGGGLRQADYGTEKRLDRQRVRPSAPGQA